jgi:hypothetical protein
MINQLEKSNKHDHFFTFENALYEAYWTLRGIRCRLLLETNYPDKDKLCEVDILIINSQLKNNNLK